jgi:Domain of unknown function (DUF4136)
MRRYSLTSAALLLGTMLLVPLTAPAALAQSVKADFDKSTDFSKYKTFAFKKGTDAPTPFAQERIVNAITAQLKARGMSPSDTPDLFVFTHAQVSTEKRMDVTTFGYGGYPGWGGWGGSFGTSTVHETNVPIGTLVIDLVDAPKDSLVWRGVGTDTLLTNPTPEKSEKRINKAVAKMFQKYPVPAVEEKKKK